MPDDEAGTSASLGNAKCWHAQWVCAGVEGRERPGWEARMGQPMSPSTHIRDSSDWPLPLESWMIEIWILLLRQEQVKCHLRKATRTGLSAGKHHLASLIQAFFRCATALWPKCARASYGGCQGAQWLWRSPVCKHPALPVSITGMSPAFLV